MTQCILFYFDVTKVEYIYMCLDTIGLSFWAVLTQKGDNDEGKGKINRSKKQKKMQTSE
jgi:hypothetical protein